jgi:hypothetical protein
MVSYTLRIPDELYQQIKQAAERDQRSIQGQILWLVGQGLSEGQQQ